MGSNFSMKYNVDLVMCIDATGSMGGLIDKVKNNALNFYSDVTKLMQEKGKSVDNWRVKVIAFRDYEYDGVSDAMLTTDFFTLPEQSADLKNALSMISAHGGGDDPEDGLEALAYAIKSDWTRKGTKKRHVIVVWSDDATHDLGVSKKVSLPGYDEKLPRSFSELTELWDDNSVMDRASKRLVLFTPDLSSWKDISDLWDNVVHYPSEAGQGLSEVDYSVILNEIANSI